MKHKFAFDNISFEGDSEQLPALHPQINTVTVDILGITCQSCVQSIEGRISKINGIVNIKVSLEQSNAIIKYLGAEISPHQICEEIKDMGFDASVGDAAQSSGQWADEALVKIRVEGMTCQSCVNTIEEKIGKLHGVKKIKVALNNQEATITYHPLIIKPEELKDIIDSLGYESIIKQKQAPLKLGLIDPELLRQIDRRMPGGLDRDNEMMESSISSPSVAVLDVEGMHCKSCVNIIESSLSDMPGVRCIKVSLGQRNAVVWFDKNLITPSSLQQAIQALPPGNFKVSFSSGGEDQNRRISNTASSLPYLVSNPPQVRLQSESSVTVIRIEGMTCNSCVKSIESSISQRKGVVQISVSLTEGTAVVFYSSVVTNSEELRAAIEDMGFDASVLTGISELFYNLSLVNGKALIAQQYKRLIINTCMLPCSNILQSSL